MPFLGTVRNCTASLVGQAQLQVEEASTMTDILLPSSVTTPTLLFLQPRVPAPSKRCKTAQLSHLYGRIDKNLGLLSSFRPPPKNLPLVYRMLHRFRRE